MPRLTEIEPVFVDTMPDSLESGKLYISHKFRLAIHLCACGCGGKSVTPFSHVIKGNDHGWKFTFEGEEGPGLAGSGSIVSLSPSIGNWTGQTPYHAHYHIKRNKIVWS